MLYSRRRSSSCAPGVPIGRPAHVRVRQVGGQPVATPKSAANLWNRRFWAPPRHVRQISRALCMAWEDPAALPAARYAPQSFTRENSVSWLENLEAGGRAGGGAGGRGGGHRDGDGQGGHVQGGAAIEARAGAGAWARAAAGTAIRPVKAQDQGQR